MPAYLKRQQGRSYRPIIAGGYLRSAPPISGGLASAKREHGKRPLWHVHFHIPLNTSEQCWKSTRLAWPDKKHNKWRNERRNTGSQSNFASRSGWKPTYHWA